MNHESSKLNKFCKSWVESNEFIGWLAHKSDLLAHSKTDKHQKNAKKVGSNTKLREFINRKADPLQELVNRAEIKLTGLLATNNLPFTLMDTLSSICGDLFPDSQIAKKIAVRRTKSTKIMTECLGKTLKNDLYGILKGSFFSMIMDETTDKGTVKQCAFSVIYFSSDTNTVENKFFDMVETASGTAEDLYQSLKLTIVHKNIPFQNFIGFSSDTTNSMFGEHQPVVALLKKDAPDICTVKCSCHMIHLCASKACLKLPRSAEDLLRNLGAHFSRSFSRQQKLKEFQEFFQTEIHKILKMSNTRWLSLQACVDRVLEQFEPLKGYLQVTLLEDPSKTTEEMLSAMNNPFTKLYLEFMSYTLGILNDFNTLFQSSSPLLYKLKPEVSRLLKNLYLNFLDASFVKSQDPLILNHENPNHFLPLEKNYLGVATTESIVALSQTCSKNDLNQFLITCLNFYRELVTQIKRRFLVSDPIFDIISVVDPTAAQSFQTTSLVPVINRFPVLKNHVNVQQLDNEWRDHALLDFQNLDAGLPVEAYWKKVFELKNKAGALSFPTLKVVISLLLILPFSNVSIERIFSDLNLIKNDLRNSLNTETIVSIIFSKQAIQANGGIVQFNPTSEMFELKNNIWKNSK